jgi:hypothetical protein
MKKLMVMVATSLFLTGLVSLSLAGGMMDTMKGKAEEAKGASTEAHKGMDMKEAGTEAAIETQSATKEEAGGMVDQLKEGAKGEVNKKGKTVNESIDNIGK